MLAKDAVGVAGEEMAKRWLADAGWDVLATNWRCEVGEIDIVARDGAEVVIVEVKTRTSLRYGDPTEAVDHDKLAKLRHLAALWLAENPTGSAGVRIDVIGIVRPGSGQSLLRHLKGVG